MENQLEDMLTELLNLQQRMDDIYMKCLADSTMTLNIPIWFTSSACTPLSCLQGNHSLSLKSSLLL